MRTHRDMTYIQTCTHTCITGVHTSQHYITLLHDIRHQCIRFARARHQARPPPRSSSQGCSLSSSFHIKGESTVNRSTKQLHCHTKCKVSQKYFTSNAAFLVPSQSATFQFLVIFENLSIQKHKHIKEVVFIIII